MVDFSALKPLSELQKLASAWGGIVICGIVPGSAADRACMRYGDILLEVAGRPVPDLASYIAVRRDVKEPLLPLHFVRDGEERDAVLDMRDHATSDRA